MNFESIRDSLISIDEPYQPQPELRCAGVLVAFVESKDRNWQILLTTRASHLKHHPGQISFPGGSYETHDGSLAQTAIRETQEEIGISPQHIQLLGRLPEQQTISKYNITPYVAQIDSNYRIKVDKNEVDEVFTVPLAFLSDLSHYKTVARTYQGKNYHYYVIQYKHYNIWGATAKILHNLVSRIN
ncbi:CoA pyrophosphatase [Aliikangiella sp. IMCC44653]